MLFSRPNADETPIRVREFIAVVRVAESLAVPAIKLHDGLTPREARRVVVRPLPTRYRLS